MEQHERQAVITEKRNLDEKLDKLKAFCFNPGSQAFDALPPIDRDLLEDQYNAMKDYSEILDKQIRRFGQAKEGK